MDHTNLRYSDERDKIYGLAGMAITLVALDSEKYLCKISLDSPADESIAISYDNNLSGNPRMSARIVWEQTLADLRMTTSMTLGNIACRRYVLGHRGISDDDIKPIREIVRAEGLDNCGLDTDESDHLLESCLSYVQRVFRHPDIQEIAHNFAGHIERKRTLSGAEAIEILNTLGLS